MPWTVTLGGVRYTALPVSGEAVRQFQRAVTEAGPDVVKQDAALFALLRLAFPLSWAVFWKGDAARKLLVDPRREELLADFFGYLKRQSKPASRTNGTRWKPRTVTR